jgi:hypothetical protein
VDSVFDQPGDEAAQFALMNFAPLIERDERRCEGTFQPGGHR